jgi:hypothetical protein
MLKRILTATVLAALRSSGVVRATPGSGCAVSPSFCVTPLARYTTDASIKIQAPGLGKVDTQPGQLTELLWRPSSANRADSAGGIRIPGQRMYG